MGLYPSAHFIRATKERRVSTGQVARVGVMGYAHDILV